MELKQLRSFLAVAEDLNFTRAANRMHVAQPALSQHILNLERQLGTALFRRNKQVVTLTQAGEELQLHARKVLKAADTAIDAVSAIGGGRRGRLAIGAVYSAVYAVLPDALAEFGRCHPEIEMSVREQTVSQQVAALRHGLIDVGFMRECPAEPGLVSTVLAHEPLAAVLKTTDPLALRSAISVAQLASRPLVAICSENNFGYSGRVASIFSSQDIVPKIAGYASDMHTILCMVLAGMGISVVPASVATMSNRRLVFLPISYFDAAMDSTLTWQEDSGCSCLPAFVGIVKRLSAGRNENSRLELSNGSRIDMLTI